jgi:hypothetical protein
MCTSVTSTTPIPELVGKVIDEKKRLVKKELDQRFKGKNLLREAIYVTSDVGTVGFSIVQGISQVISPVPALLFTGSISGLVGGVLNIGQGLFLCREALQFFLNGQYKQCVRIGIDGLFLLGIGAMMILISLSMLGVKLGAIGSLAANPYLIPVFFLILVLPGLIQTITHLVQTARGKDTGSELKLNDLNAERPHLQTLAKLKPDDPAAATQTISHMIEEFSDELGVEAAMEAMEFLQMLLRREEEKKLLEKMDQCQKQINTWNRMVKLRALQLSLYGLAFPFGLACSFAAASIAKIINATSKFLITVPSSIGTYLDACEPFKRNGAIAVPKVENPTGSPIFSTSDSYIAL